jgi:hypothetical protein
MQVRFVGVLTGEAASLDFPALFEFYSRRADAEKPESSTRSEFPAMGGRFGLIGTH